ncbi:MAG: VPLPA-CTERM sorting domain-containing protein [Aliishimia sp.]
MNRSLTLLAATAFAAFGLTSTLSAATLASGSVSGDYDIVTTPNSTTGGTSVFSITNGQFKGSIDPRLLPTGLADYTVSVEATLNGDTVSDSISGPLSLDQFEELAFLGFVLFDVIDSIEDVLTPLPDGMGDFLFNVTSFSTGIDGLSAMGTYELTINTVIPIGTLVDDLIASLLPELGLTTADLNGFSFPNNDKGSFAVAASIGIAPVPTPASLPLLIVGAGALVMMRRKNRTA